MPVSSTHIPWPFMLHITGIYNKNNYSLKTYLNECKYHQLISLYKQNKHVIHMFFFNHNTRFTYISCFYLYNIYMNITTPS